MQVAHSSTAAEAEADCKVAEEVWQALVWLGWWRGNVWPFLILSLHACSGQLICRSACFPLPHRADISCTVWCSLPSICSSAVWGVPHITHGTAGLGCDIH